MVSSTRGETNFYDYHCCFLSHDTRTNIGGDFTYCFLYFVYMFLLCIPVLVLHAIVQPYKSFIMNALEFGGYVNAFITFFMGALLSIETEEVARVAISIIILISNLLFVGVSVYLIISCKIHECRTLNLEYEYAVILL